MPRPATPVTSAEPRRNCGPRRRAAAGRPEPQVEDINVLVDPDLDPLLSPEASDLLLALLGDDLAKILS